MQRFFCCCCCFKKRFSVYINGNNENFSFKTEKLVFDKIQKKLTEKPKA